MVTRGNEAVEQAEEWQSVISDAVAFAEDSLQPHGVGSKKEMPEKTMSSAREVPAVDLMREQVRTPSPCTSFSAVLL
jgi:hypothetical protein